jgi:translation initiation factor 3 subunit L
VKRTRGPTIKHPSIIKEDADSFLGRLLDGLEKRQVAAIHVLYEDTYNKVSERNYKNTRWPHADLVAEQVSESPLFLVLYKELYYRHVYSKFQGHPGLMEFEDRRGSWENYCRLFDLFISDLEEGEDLSAALPAQWLWDLLDEFVYHFQTYNQHRNKMAKQSATVNQAAEELQKIQAAPEVFDTCRLISYLQSLVEKSKIEDYLSSTPEEREAKKATAGAAFQFEIVRRAGYFALMQLLRVHSLLGDYHLAMSTIKHIDFKAGVPMYYEIPACHIHLCYYMGFGYMMMRRYIDAIRTFCDILVFLQKTSGHNVTSYQYSVMSKKQDSMYSLLLICLALSPQPVDEMIQRTIQDKYADRQMRLQRDLSEARGTYEAFEELFTFNCPKFVSAAPPDFEKFGGGVDYDYAEAHKRQANLFLQEVRQQQALPTIGSYMKLYTAIEIGKLAQLTEIDEEGLRNQLMCVMHKTTQPVRPVGEEPLSGTAQCCSEVQFYLDGDTVHINSQRTQRPHEDFFLEHIGKFQDLLKKVESTAGTKEEDEL